MKVKELLRLYSPLDTTIEMLNNIGYTLGFYDRNTIEKSKYFDYDVEYFNVNKAGTIKIMIKEED